MPTAPVTRFAPSPTGELHLGHAYSALFAEREATRDGGRFLLRIEDIDAGRCRPEFEMAILKDLDWLGIVWETPVRRQSEHMADYAAGLNRLTDMGLLYPCFCTRREIAAELAAAGQAPHGEDGPLYPGTCRHLDPGLRAERMATGLSYALRLDVGGAVRQVGPLAWIDREKGRVEAHPEIFGDVIMARKDTPASYHLACTWDDALQGVTLVTRGQDLFLATHVHRLLQALLGLPSPDYHHHRLLTDDSGRRLAKRDRAQTLRSLRDQGVGAEELRRQLGFD